VKITPLDIRKQTFRTVFRGADNEEVRVFLDLVATEYENLLAEHGQMSERLRHSEDRLNEYRELDQTLRNSLLTAERLSQEAKDSSQREAGLILQDAEWRAKQMLEDARERLQRLADEVRDLQSKKEAFAQHLRSFLRSQLDLLDNNEGVLDGINRLADEVNGTVSRTRRPEAARPAAPTQAAAPPPPAVAAGSSAPAANQGMPANPVTGSPAAPSQSMPGATTGQPAAPMPPEWSEPARPPVRPTIPTGQGHPSFVPPPAQPPVHPAPPVPPPAVAASAPASAERTEGLFEISAEEDYPPRP
jgi:cell division initiation protein